MSMDLTFPEFIDSQAKWGKNKFTEQFLQCIAGLYRNHLH